LGASVLPGQFLSVTGLIALLTLAIWGYLLAARGRFWRMDVAVAPSAPAAGMDWPAVTAVVPARDEAEVVGAAVRSLLDQDYGGPLHVILVDDDSSDGTADRAREAARCSRRPDALTVVRARARPSGWVGKVWAMAEGLARAEADHPAARYILFTDADIGHPQNGLGALVTRAETDGLDLASLMVRLHCETPAERALIPAFVFFFRMLYPFAWVGDPARSMAAAAGGVMLVRRSALDRIGGLAVIRSALIDDCALARALKAGGPIWLGLADRTHSIRGYGSLAALWKMVARSAYTQLDHSPLLLAGTVLGMALTFIAPPALLLAGGGPALPGGIAYAAMIAAYLPSLRYYRCSLLWALALPAVALIYLGATLDSARRHWAGRGGEWKGRTRAGVQ
jgi:hopene-associated glycosyltransferase HpnB